MSVREKFFIYDKWLADIIKCDAYQIIASDEFIRKAGEPDTPVARQLDEMQNSKVFIYARVAADNLTVVRFLEEKGFNLIDTTAIFSKLVEPEIRVQVDGNVGFAVADDEERLVSLSRRSFEYSRFHLDSAFTPDVADETRARWVQSYFSGDRGNAIVVAREENVLVGFLLLIYRENNTLVIDLIAVDRDFRRRGIAGDMIRFAEANCPGYSNIRVGTQIANLPSIHFYESLGFRIVESQYVFHYHHD